MQNVKHNNIFKIFSLIAFGIITLVIMLNRAPFWDEAHSWMIAKSFSFWELISEVERFDGHLFIWHVLQMPFAKNDFHYPYPVYIMNWVFCIMAMTVFWIKAPFSNLEKFLITFSYPFVYYFAPVARCYSLGILFLFIILSLWKEKLKHPLLVPFLIICFANTSVMALTATVPISLIYVFDLIKNKQKLYMPFLIFIFGAYTVLFQLLGSHLALSGKRNFICDTLLPFFLLHPITDIKNFLASAFSVFSAIILCLFFCLFKKHKKSCFFLAVTYGIMITIFMISYPGSWWHYLQFFAYFIAAVWIMRTEDNDNDYFFTRLFNLIFLFVLVLFFTYSLFVYDSMRNTLPYKGTAKLVYEDIKKQGFINDKNRIITLDSFSETSVGFLPYTKIKTYNIYGDVKYSIRGIQNYYKDNFSKNRYDILAESLIDTGKTNLAITSEYIGKGIYQGEKHKVCLDLIYKNDDIPYFVYKISAK